MYHPGKSWVRPLTRASVVLAAISCARADLVAKWTGDTFTDDALVWTDSISNIEAATNGLPIVSFDQYNTHQAVELGGTDFFVIPASGNPIANVTEFTLVAVFEPFAAGAGDGQWWNASGIIGMELGGNVPDWGFGMTGNHITSGTGGGNDAPINSPDFTTTGAQIAMMTWSSTGGTGTGTADSGVQRLFVNGVQVAQQNAANQPRSPEAFALGAMTVGGAGGLVANLVELRMYNSDESANAAAITGELRTTYFEEAILQSTQLTPTGGTIVIEDTSSIVDETGEFEIALDSTPIPPANITVSKTDGTTTVTFTADIAGGRRLYFIDLAVPIVGSSEKQEFFPEAVSYAMPAGLAGAPGTTSSWGIREYTILGANSIELAAEVAVNATEPFIESTSPVFNHSDPDTQNPGTSGFFNNDFNLLSNTGDDDGDGPDTADDDFVVVGKTQFVVTEESDHTFAVHSDDGFVLKITGPAGGRFVSASGLGAIDPGDNQAIFLDGGTGDSNTRGVYHFDGPGTYEIQYLGYDGGGGGYYELSSAEGAFTFGRDTNTWTLVGNPADPSLPPFRERMIANLPGPAPTGTTFGVRVYQQAAGAAGDINAASNFLATTTRAPSDADGLTVDVQSSFIDFKDPQNGGAVGVAPADKPFPGDTAADDDNVVTVAKGRISIPSTGAYTFWVQSDDGFVLRLKGVDGSPDPIFRRATQGGNEAQGRFDMSNLNEIYFDGGTGNSNTRGIIDLAAGQYDVEFVSYEGGGGSFCELSSAAGEWPHGTEPPGGFALVGLQPFAVTIPGIAEPGWTVESSTPGRGNFETPPGALALADTAIDQTLADGTAPAEKISIWDDLNFHDPQDGPQGTFTPTNPWPLNTAGPDNNYAMRATGTLNITEAGEYLLGFQGDDGGYLYINGLGGLATPAFNRIVATAHPTVAVIGEQTVGSGVNNAIRVDVGTGDSRTIVSANLEVGQYELKTLVFEGVGGSWWEVFGAKEPGPDAFPNYRLLAKGPGSSVNIGGGLALVDPTGTTVPHTGPFVVSSFDASGNPVNSVSFDFTSTAGATYSVQGSIDLQNWTTIQSGITGVGGSNSVTIDTTALPAPLNGSGEVFFRVFTN